MLLATEMLMLFSEWWLAPSRLLAATLQVGVIGRLTELVLVPTGHGHMRIVSPHEPLVGDV